MQYNKTATGDYETLKQQNVDTGMGLERTAAVLSGLKSVYDIEPLSTIVSQIAALAPALELAPEFSGSLDLTDQAGVEVEKSIRIIADHLRAATFILAENIEPSNVEQGYVLRRLIRRAIRHGKKIGIEEHFTVKIVEVIIDKMGGFYKELRTNRDFITEQMVKEEEKFNNTLEKGLKEFSKLGKDKIISGQEVFKLFTTYGFPYDMTMELAKENNLKVDMEAYQKEFAKHQELSRTASAGKFKGGLADSSTETTRLHTAAHLMLAALRQVLGDHVYQKGSNITAERLRFDFSHPDKLTDDQKKQVEDIVNIQIAKKLPVTINEMTVAEAKAAGAMGVFEDKYGEKVKVYTMGDSIPDGQVFSQEICGGPHVQNTGELGHFKIQKEESSSAGVRRIKAILQ